MMDHEVDRRFGRGKVKVMGINMDAKGYISTFMNVVYDQQHANTLISYFQKCCYKVVLWDVFFLFQEYVQITGPRELCGAVDLISRFRLQPYHEFFCKKALPSSVSDTNYLKSVVGDREIRKGERLISDQLSLIPPHVKKGGSQIHAFDLKVLWEAFEIRQAPSLCLYPGVERAAAGSKYGYKGKRKHNSHKTKRKDNKRSKHHHHHDKRMGSKSKWAG